MKKLTLLLGALLIAFSSVFAVDVTDQASLEAAVAGINDDETISLQSDIALTSTVILAVDKKYTIDLNGKTISNDTLTTHAKNMIVVNAGNVTLTNGKIFSPNSRGVTANAGKLALTAIEIETGQRALCVYDASQVVLAVDATAKTTGNDNTVVVWGDTDKQPIFDCNGKIEGINGCGIYTAISDPSAPIININATAEIADSVAIWLSTGTCTIAQGAKITATKDAAIILGWDSDKLIAGDPVLNCAGIVTAGEDFAITGNGTDIGHPIVNILEGAVITSQDIAIYQPEAATLNISGGIITGTTAVYAKCGSVTITGGKLVATGAKKDYDFYGNGANATGDALVIDNCNYPQGVATVAITGGEFESANAAAVGSYVGNGVAEEQVVSDFIAGGTFNGAEGLAPELVKEGAEIVLEDAKINVDPESWNAILTLANGEAKADKAFDVTGEHLVGEITSEITGDNAANFEWNATRQIVKFSATAAGTYKAQLVLSSKGAEAKTVELEVVVNAPTTPELIVKPEEWKTNLVLKGGKAEAERQISITGKHIDEDIVVALQKGTEFQWIEAEGKVTFLATETGTYEDTLVVSSGEVSVKVALEAVVTRPVITIGATELAFGTVSLDDAINGRQQQETTVSVEPEEEIRVEVSNPAFLAEIKDGKVIITFKTNSAGNYEATATIKADDAEDKVIALTASVEMPAPELKVNPLRWEESIAYANGIAKAVRPISIVAIGVHSIPDVTLQNGTNFSWDADKSQVVFEAYAYGKYIDTLVVSATGAETVRVPMIIIVNQGGDGTPVISAGAEELAWGEIDLNEAKEGVAKETTASVNLGILEVAVEGTNKEAFTAELANGKLTVTFKATELGSYAATAVLSAIGAENKTIALSATVVEPAEVGGWVTDPTTLKAGDKIIITNKTGLIAMSKTQVTEASAIYRSITDFNESDISDEVEVVELVASGENFKLKVTGGFLYYDDAWLTAGNKGKPANWLGTNATGSDFAFEANGEFMTIKEVKNSGYILYSYNSGSNSRFTRYKATNSVTDGETKIYKIVGPKVIPTTTISIAPTTAEIEVGKTVTLTVTRDGNDQLTWTTSDATVATVKDGVVTGLKEGTATITATANGKSASCVVTVKAGQQGDIPNGTVAEFIANGGGKCYLTGVVSNIKTNSDGSYNVYGNFNLTDATGTIYVYGLLTADGQAKQFQTMGVDEGDTLKVIAEEYKLYNETPEIVNAIFVEVKKAGSVVPDIDLSDIDFAQAIYSEPTEGAQWEIQAYPYTGAEEKSYPFLDFVIKANSKTKLAGTYAIQSASISTSATETRQYTGGNVVITCLEKETDESFAIYNFVLTLKDEAGKNVTYQIEVEVMGYDAKAQTRITFEDLNGGDDTPTKTIAEFIANKGGKCYLTGVVSNIKTNNDGTYNVYGNFDLTDASGTIYVYGILTPDGQKQQFQTMGVDEGDTLKIIAEKYQLYKETHEIVDAIFVEVKKGKGTPSGDVLDVDYAEAAYLEDIEGPYWELFAAKSVPGTDDLNYPAIVLEIDNTNRTHFAGTFDIFGGALYTSEKDSIVFASGTAYISCLEVATETTAPYYKVVAKVVDAAGKQHTYEFEVEIYAYDGMNSTDENIIWIDLEDEVSQGIENTIIDLDINTPIYNIQGMQVDRSARGVLIQNGRKFIIVQ